MDLIELIKELNKLFNTYNFHVYAVGGTVRDYLLKRELKDFDFATDAKPEDMKYILENYNDIFLKYGVLIYRFHDIKCEITSFREEKKYLDSRHPKEITFVNDMSIDYKRRDFTINALYMDEKGKVYDFCDGFADLNNKIIRVIGDIDTRMKEDPLRILRAIRFSMSLGFELEPLLKDYIINNLDLLNNLNIDKIKQEISKMKKINKEETEKIIIEYHINRFIS